MVDIGRGKVNIPRALIAFVITCVLFAYATDSRATPFTIVFVNADVGSIDAVQVCGGDSSLCTEVSDIHCLPGEFCEVDVDLHPGCYELRVAVFSNGLMSEFSNSMRSPTVDTSLCGDMNLDGVVTSLDFPLFLDAYIQSVQPPQENE